MKCTYLPWLLEHDCVEGSCLTATWFLVGENFGLIFYLVQEWHWVATDNLWGNWFCLEAVLERFFHKLIYNPPSSYLFLVRHWIVSVKTADYGFFIYTYFISWTWGTRLTCESWWMVMMATEVHTAVCYQLLLSELQANGWAVLTWDEANWIGHGKLLDVSWEINENR